MPTPDDHLQDPALARALRDLDLPGPPVPRWSAEQVRRRGVSRRRRRHALWAGSGVVAAVLAGALVMGPLTPGRGPGPTGGAAQGSSTAAPGPTQQSLSTPEATGPEDSPSPSAAPSETSADGYPNVSADLSLETMELETYKDQGALQTVKMRFTVNAGARAALIGQTHGTVDMIEPSSRFAAELVGFGTDTYDYTLRSVITLTLKNGAQVKITAPVFCANKCGDDTLPGYSMIMLESEADALRLVNALEVGLYVGITPAGSQTSDPVQDATLKNTPTGKRAPGKNAPLTPSQTGRTPSATAQPTGAVEPRAGSTAMLARPVGQATAPPTAPESPLPPVPGSSAPPAGGF
ncbi:hypothetical protein [Yinghuangia soli]|uniref:Uncharacterized protein n=1 Tax=Yinghuangia soli TaxID=2908204 RepID=A0AA41Q0R8_9ACTN|nr:hypothetical protein [Yinghuangia soli]MCF2529444.1 hypothetical protein [Yinghuangia soli]